MESRKAPLIAFVEAASKMGGVQFSTLYLAQELSPEQFHVLVICPEEGDLPQKCRESGIPIQILSRRAAISTSIKIGNRYVPNILAWVVNLSFWLAYAIRLSRLLHKHNVQLVCTKGIPSHFYGGLAAKLNRLPCVWHVQDLVSNRAGGLYPFILGTVGRFFAKSVIADGSTIFEQLSRYIPAKRFHVIHNGVDIERFAPSVDGSRIRNEWNVGKSDILIGNVARLTPWKGQQYLAEAFAHTASEFPNTKLVLVGSPVFDKDDFEKSLRTFVLEHRLETRVIFAGYRWDLPEVLAAMDIFAHPSIEKDTSPLAIVSAMASGKPIIATSVQGIAELFRNEEESVLLVPPKNTDALADAIHKLVSNSNLRDSFGRAARKNAEENLSLSIFTRRCADVFMKILMRKTSR
jgi:glycosyltransferase involved in cell wall biosynthesis